MKKIQTEGVELYLRDEKDWGFWQNGFYEPEETALIKKLVKSNFVCLDVGANIGYYTILMAKQCKLVWSYEPEASNCQLLKKNIMLNKTFNIYVNRVALTEHSGQAKLYISPINYGMHRMFKSVFCDGAMLVKTQKFDDAWDNLGQFPIDFIKMDVEGSEFGVLKGMKQMLKKCKPITIMEFHPMTIREYGADPYHVYQFMKELGYTIKLIPDIDNPISYEHLLQNTKDQSGGRNILCV